MTPHSCYLDNLWWSYGDVNIGKGEVRNFEGSLIVDQSCLKTQQAVYRSILFIKAIKMTPHSCYLDNLWWSYDDVNIGKGEVRNFEGLLIVDQPCMPENTTSTVQINSIHQGDQNDTSFMLFGQLVVEL